MLRGGAGVLLAAALAGMAGCASSPEAARAPSRGIAYRVTTDNCQCERYTMKDRSLPVQYEVAAAYEIEGEFITRINVTVFNRGTEMVDFTDAYARVTSRNVPFQYNKKFVPLTAEPVAPQGERTIELVGRAAPRTSDPWLAVAGEELVLTVKGIKYGSRTLAEQSVSFVPRNPKLAN